MPEDSSDWVDSWNDVQPIPQDDGPRPAVPIAYSAEFVRVMGYFRAALACDERSQRSLDLTRRVIALNAANYTAWHFRRLCLEALGSDLQQELDYLDAMGQEHAKNYQLWHHRRWVAEQLGKGAAKRELEFSEKTFVEGDAKNYHVWSHRQWVLRELGGATWKEEIGFCSRLLQSDVWNNSAWNQRMFAYQELLPVTGEGAPDAAERDRVFEDEVHFVVQSIRGAPANESAWSYLTGLYSVWGKKAEMAGDSAVLDLCREVMAASSIGEATEEEAASEVTSNRRPPGSPSPCGSFLAGPVHVLSLVLELLGAGADPSALRHVLGESVLGADQVGLGISICSRLKEIDAMRQNYWELRKSMLE